MEDAIQKIPVVRVKNVIAGDIIFSAAQWADLGGYRGFIKEKILGIRDIEGVEYTTMDPRDFDKLTEWQG